MVDRVTRDRMAGALERYLDEEITAFQLDAELDGAARVTEDRTAWDLRLAVWANYDDLVDHKVTASREQWHYLQRVLLLLRSDGEFELTRRRRRWSLRQAGAGLALLLFSAV